MSTLTPNLELKVPEATDPLETVRSDYAYNLNKLDENGGGGGGSGHTIVNENGTDMPAESKLQFTGNVSVTDDSTNGKTIVDVEGGASVVELTQAEYEALPDSKLTDGILYGLKDVKSFLDPDILYLGDCYSTSERMIGCWYNGKPLYQKTYTRVNVTISGANTWYDTGISAGDIEELIGGEMQDRFNYQFFPVAVAFGSSHTKILVSCPMGNREVENLTIRYTKSTDAVGSGTWTPSGVNAVHYDDTEKIIGTWFGETLYEKTIHIVEQSEQTNKNYTAEITSLNASHIKLKNAEVKLGSNGGNAWYTAPFWYDGSYNMCVAVSPNDMNIFSRGWKYTEAYVTLQYTKSS